ncbi:MAG: efflux RND transporter permease subunit [Pirellulales bacterium]|nr:efflux RND transporter permease subunit [Pirellulales bacterium]
MIGYFVRHPTAANLLMLAVVLLGLLGAVSLTREVFPEFASEFINVQVIYKGASAEEVEETICRRIEEEIEGTEGIEKVTSTSRENMGMVTIEVADGYEVRDVLKDVENAVDQIDNFPEDIEEPLIWDVDRIDRVCTVTVWAEQEMPEKDLVALADTIENELLELDAVSLVKRTGVSEHQIRVEVREEALLALGLTINDVAREIQAQSIDLPAGSVETGHREIKIRVVDQRRWAEDFRDLAVQVSPSEAWRSLTDGAQSRAGARIPLRAIATVTDTFEDEWTRATFQGHRCINLDISKTRAEDTIRVKNAVQTYVDARLPTLPSGVHLTLWGDWSLYVRDRLGMLVENGVLGFVLVFFTLWAMLHLRLAVWVAVGIPISFLGTLFVMDRLDMSLNMITMFSLILAVGIIVDDAIVIGENIFAHYAAGKPAAQAAVDGTKEVATGVIASMLTTVAVFMPLLTMEGDIGKVLRVMPIGVITALTVSLVEAFLILPNHLTHSLHKIPPEPSRLRAATDRLVAWFTQRVYGPVLDWSARRPLVPLAAAIMLFLIALGLLFGGRLKFQLFPELDGDFLVAQVELPNGTDLARTRQVVRQIEEALQAVERRFQPQPADQQLIRYVNSSFGFSRTVGLDPELPETGSHLAQVLVELLSADQRTARCDDVLQVWREEVRDVADVVNLTFEQMQVTPGGKPIDIQLRGKDLHALRKASLELQHQVKRYPGIRNVTDNLRPGKAEVLVRLKPAGRPLGISSAALAVQLREAFWGNIAQQFQRGADTFEVEVLFAPENRRSLADLDDFKVRTPDGRMMPFHEVATAKEVRGYSQIVRVDGRRTISVTADLDTARGNAAEIMADLRTHFFEGFLERNPAVKINLEGQSKETQKTGMSVVRGFVVGLCMIFILLSFVFKSYVEPLIVMAAIPFGLVGAVAGHLLLRIDWTMPSTVGFVSLAGIIVNDSIVLVGFIKLRLAEGKGLHEAVHQAGMQRFRPVFLTSATTVAGLLPIMLEASLQAQFLIPMAVSISFGLMFATVLVLLMVPCLYVVLAKLGWSAKVT